MKKSILLTVIAAAMLGLAACGTTKTSETPASGQTTVLQQQVDPATVSQIQSEIDDGMEDYDPTILQAGYLDYSMELFRRSVEDGKNGMISPVSAMMALDMLAAGAKGETQTQITDMFCPGVSQTQMENYCRDLMERYNTSTSEDFDNEEDIVKLHLANSLWINDRFAERMNEDYLVRTNYIFDAEAAALPFDDAATDIINSWCSEHTDGMIPGILDQIEPGAQLYLINATAIDAPWANPYDDYQVADGIFTNVAGAEEDIKMMSSTEGTYFESDDAVGFLKYYKGGEYGFLAILPEEGVSVDEYVRSLTGEKYQALWDSRTRDYDVLTKMPEFSYDYEVKLNDILKAMGMTQAFIEGGADLTGIADADLFVSLVLQKTFVEVGQYRTRAAAVTVVADVQNAMFEEPEYKEVYLDRPFVYAIVETNTGMPLFIGTMQTVE